MEKKWTERCFALSEVLAVFFFYPDIHIPHEAIRGSSDLFLHFSLSKNTQMTANKNQREGKQ